MDRLLRIARRVGCVIEQEPQTPLEVGGEVFCTARIRCRDNVHAVELLNAFAEDDARNDVELVAFAARMKIRGMRPGDVARRIHAFVKDSVSFSEEDGEKFRLPSLTLRLGTGDCDDSAHLIASLAMALGLPARVVLLNNSRGEASHVVAQIAHDGAFHWAEATFDAEYDEHPHEAAIRLGIMRRDVA